MSQAAARVFVEEAALAALARGRFAAALSGGSTPRRTYEILASPPLQDRIDWRRVHLFWSDERGAPPEDPRSNYLMAMHTLVRRVSIPPGHVHPMAAYPALEEGAQAYEAELRAFFAGGPPRVDLVFLGLGADGHTASLFPGSPLVWEEKLWVAPVAQTGPDGSRMTLTPLVLNQAALVVFLVAGAAKAGVLREVLEGPRDPMRLPAQAIVPTAGKLMWLVDREAAAALSRYN